MTFTPGDTRIDERFWKKIAVTDNGCWEFTGSKSNGYGKVQRGGVKMPTHQFTWTRLVGPIPDGLEVDHLCRNRPCCNPEHLEPVTHRENVLRGESPCAKNAKKTHCSKGHEYTPENIMKKYLPARQCLECYRESRYQWSMTKSYGYDRDDDWLYLDYDE